MKKDKTQDEQIDDLCQIIQERREEISNAETPNWITKGTFKYGKGDVDSFDLKTITNVNVFISALAFLIGREKSYNEASEQLGVEVEFGWFGHSVEDWRTDFKSRITEVQIENKKTELVSYEKSLNKLISPEHRKARKIQKITTGLSKI